jgi:hypothetical protein
MLSGFIVRLVFIFFLCVVLCRSLSVYFSFGHCIICPASTSGFWVPLWYPQLFVSLGRLPTMKVSIFVPILINNKLPVFYIIKLYELFYLKIKKKIYWHFKVYYNDYNNDKYLLCRVRDIPSLTVFRK